MCAAEHPSESPLDVFRIPSSTDVRLHQNESPYPMSPAAALAARAALAAASRYPDAGAPELCRSLAEHYGVEPAMVAAGAGSGELILTACRAWGAPGRPVLVTMPGFPGYEMMAGIAGVPVCRLASPGYRVDVGSVVGALPGAGCAFVCSPSNPTGAALEPGEVRALAAAASRADGVLVLDEAYAEFAGPAHRSGLDEVRAGARLVVLRTFSKAYGLAGLRVGYAIGPADLITQLRRHLPPFTVSRVAQAAACAALGDQELLRQTVERVEDGRRVLEEGLAALGFGVVPSAANFAVVAVPGGDARVPAAGLAARSVLVQELTRFGLPGHLRITVGTEEQNRAVLRTLADLTAAGRSTR